VPEDLGSFYRQQLKWARGVYEVVLSEMPRLFRTLSWRQRASYFTIGSYYFFGVTAPLFLLIPYLYLWFAVQPAAMRFAQFVSHGLPVAAAGVAVYLLAQRWLVDPERERGLHLRGMALKLACWPVFLAGTLLAVIRAEIPYIPTAKEAVRGRFLRLAWPQLVTWGVFFATVAWVWDQRVRHTAEATLVTTSEAVWGMLAFELVPLLTSLGALHAAWQARHPAPGAPWEGVDIARIGGGDA
jgi:cellulose synthase (UDP-forming)